ncbi:MAG: hypothetical protein E7266_10425 [Lachnospiraceae bacterium]|nr:hypothetical protein [Lachnospiraceae bacterium]
MNLIPNSKNNIFENTIIYESGDNISSVALIISGTVKYTSGNPCADISEITYSAGSFIGDSDIFCGFYSGNFVAMTNCIIIPFECSDASMLASSLSDNIALIESTSSAEAVANLLSSVFNSYNKLFKITDSFYNSIYSAYTRYEKICQKDNIRVESFKLPHSSDNYNIKFLDLDRSPDELLSEAASNALISDYIRVIGQLLMYYEDLFFYLKILVSSVVSKNDVCLFSIVSNLATNIDCDSTNVLRLIETMKDFTYSIEDEVKLQTGIQLNIDMTKLNFYYNLATQSIQSYMPIKMAEQAAVASMGSFVVKHTFESLMEYCSYTYEQVDSFTAKLEKYKQLNDKSSTDESCRAIRRELSKDFYKLYEDVFFTYAKTEKSEPYVDLFLNLGLLDETLLDEDQIHELTSLSCISGGTPAAIYYLKDWLMEIYEGKRIPSKNEFDEEYTDYIRKKKKEMNLTPEAERDLLNNPEFKVKYELNNLFKCNHRLLNGAPSTFWPMLTSEDVITSFEKSFVTGDIVNDALAEIVSVDYSVFYRESMYEDIEKGISKEVIVKEIYPEIILLPCVGSTGTMWQEISGKRINTAGRFVLPTFFNGDLSNVLLRLLGRFRWELCKSAQGLAWNDISIPSLTSLFTDYAQFYRKNSELSPERKEALKNQLSRCRNNIREVFVLDYCMWIKFEAKGAMRLDKVARRILATYCPMEKSLREKYASHPAFAEAMIKYNLDKNKKIKELSGRYGSLSRKGIELTDELLITEEFYTNM